LTTLHELAHAWAESQLSTAEWAAFLELRGLDVWYDDRVARHERGMEHAAEVVSWGLMDEMIPIIRIYDAEPAQLSVRPFRRSTTALGRDTHCSRSIQSCTDAASVRRNPLTNILVKRDAARRAAG
jgi:hypothetical protein